MIWFIGSLFLYFRRTIINNGTMDGSKRIWRRQPQWKVGLLVGVVFVAWLSWHGNSSSQKKGDMDDLLENQESVMESQADVEAEMTFEARETVPKFGQGETHPISEESRLSKLKSDTRLPLVYFDVEIKQRKVGRIEMVLFTDTSPRSAHNFHLLVTGEAGVVPPGLEGEGMPLHFKGAPFYRIIDGFIDQAGINTPSALNHGQFDDDEGGLRLKHEYKGLLSMANMGPNTNTAHFSIMINPAPHLDGQYTIFGQVVSGFEVVDEINALARGKEENTATAEAGAIIADCGELRKGTLEPQL